MEKDESSEASGAQVTREPTDDDIGLIAEQIRAGNDEETIAAMLEDRGLDRVQARSLLDTVYPRLARVAEEERYTGSALGPGIAGGLIAAVVGGFLWGLIVILSEYEIGIAAWGIGFLAGFGVVRFAGGAKGRPLQVVAVVSSLLGMSSASTSPTPTSSSRRSRTASTSTSPTSTRRSSAPFAKISATSSGASTSSGPASPSSPPGG